jgi:hypothetical protein
MDARQPFKYRAFISCSHAGGKRAKWLHKSLETYRMPRRLVGRKTECGVAMNPEGTALGRAR